MPGKAATVITYGNAPVVNCFRLFLPRRLSIQREGYLLFLSSLPMRLAPLSTEMISKENRIHLCRKNSQVRCSIGPLLVLIAIPYDCFHTSSTTNPHFCRSTQ